jgi:microcin C transport system permease protein
MGFDVDRKELGSQTAFFVIAIMLSLLIFIGEAVRDALDPRKTLA